MVGDNHYPKIGDVHSSRIEDCEPMRTVSLYFGRLHPNQFEENQVCVEEDQSQPETGYPFLVKLIQWHSEVKLSLYVFQTDSSKNIIHYSAFVCPILIATLALFVDLQLCSVTPSGNANRGNANRGNATRTRPCLEISPTAHRLWWLRFVAVCVSAPCHGTELEIHKESKLGY